MEWFEIQDVKPQNGDICMVAYRSSFAGQTETNYKRAVWFDEDTELKVGDVGEHISREGFYVPADIRPLGIAFVMLMPTLVSVIGWQKNDAPYVPVEGQTWEFEIV